jgi:hypothetical protein
MSVPICGGTSPYHLGKVRTHSKNRNIVAKQMTSAQLAEAQKLARECIQKKYKGCMILSSKPAEQSAPPANNAPSLNEAKKECEDLGFKPKTEKFGACVLQLTDN